MKCNNIFLDLIGCSYLISNNVLYDFIHLHIPIITGWYFCGIHPIVVCQIKTDLHTAISHSKVNLLYATCFGYADHTHVFKYITLEPIIPK